VEQYEDRTALRNLILGVLLGVILSRFSLGSIFMTVPVLLVCPRIRKAWIRIASFAALLLAVAAWTLIENRQILGTEYWPVVLVSLYLPVSGIVGAAVWTIGADYSRSSIRKFFWACIPVFVLGLALSMYFATDASKPIRTALAEGILYYFPSDYLNVDISSVLYAVVDMMMLFFAPLGVLMLTFPIVTADVNVNRYNEEWQYDFANMKLPDPYVWVFFASWAASLLCYILSGVPLWVMAVCWNVALTMSVLYLVVGVSILVAFARRRTAAVTVGRLVILVVLVCFIPVVNLIVILGLVLLGVLETWFRFR